MELGCLYLLSLSLVQVNWTVAPDYGIQESANESSIPPEFYIFSSSRRQQVGCKELEFKSTKI